MSELTKTKIVSFLKAHGLYSVAYDDCVIAVDELIDRNGVALIEFERITSIAEARNYAGY